jgi:hypothetical protein
LVLLGGFVPAGSVVAGIARHAAADWKCFQPILTSDFGNRTQWPATATVIDEESLTLAKTWVDKDPCTICGLPYLAFCFRYSAEYLKSISEFSTVRWYLQRPVQGLIIQSNIRDLGIELSLVLSVNRS